MSMSLLEFQEAVAEHGLVSDGTLQQVFETWQGPPAQTAENLARELMRRRLMTKFQAQVVHSGRGASLVLGNYVLLDKIGEGGMGLVYKAEHRRMKRVVALKVLPPEKVRDMAVARFERELQAAARLTHPHVITAHDADEVRGIYFYVMEYVDGCDLSSLVKKNGPLPVATATDYLRQACLGVAYAHQLGVIHRDIKPSNLLLDSSGTVKVLDLGIARLEDAVESSISGLTATGMVMGTIDFMAPEQAVNAKRADARSDIYSLGCTLHYLLTGQVVYSSGTTMMERILAHREEPVPSLRSARPDVPQLLDGLFQRMLQKKAEDRPPHLQDVLQVLETMRLPQQPAQVSRPVTAPVPAAREFSHGSAGGAVAPRSQVYAMAVKAGGGNPEATPILEFLETRDQSRYEPVGAGSRHSQDPRTHSTLNANRETTRESRQKPARPRRSGWRWVLLVGICAVMSGGIIIAMNDWNSLKERMFARPTPKPESAREYEPKPEAISEEPKPEENKTEPQAMTEEGRKVEGAQPEEAPPPPETVPPPPPVDAPPVEAPSVSRKEEPSSPPPPAPAPAPATDDALRISRAVLSRPATLDPLQCLPTDGIIAGVNIADALRLDPGRMSIEEIYAQMPEESRAILQKFRETARFDPLRDIRSVVFWTDGNIKPWGLVAIELKVAVDPRDLATTMDSTLDEMEGLPIIRSTAEGREFDLLCPAKQLLLVSFGERESGSIHRLKTAIEGGEGLSSQLRARLQTLKSSPIWLTWTITEVQHGLMLAALPADGDSNAAFVAPLREILPKIEALSFRLNRRNGVEMTLEAVHEDDDSATKTRDELQKIWDLFRPMLSSDQMLSALDETLKTQVKELVEGVSLKATGRVAQLSLSVSDGLMLKLKELVEEQAKKNAEQALPAPAPPAN